MPLTSPQRGPLIAVVALVAVAAAVVVGVVLIGGEDPEPGAVDEAPEPDPEPEPEPEPVSGELTLHLDDVSHEGTRLFGDSMPQSQAFEVDQAAAEAFADRVADWLDRHLTDLQEGGVGGVAEAGLQGSVDALTLAHEDLWVQEARYDVVVYVRGAPAWARAEVVVVRDDDSTASATLVFLPGGEPTLVAARGTGESPPASEPGPSTDQDGSGDQPADSDSDGSGQEEDA